MEKKDYKYYLEQIKETKGKAIASIPDSEKTSLLCKMAVEFDKELARYVPIKYLAEVLQGDDLIKAAAQRGVDFIYGYGRLKKSIFGNRFDEEEFVKESLNSLLKDFEVTLPETHNMNQEEIENLSLHEKITKKR